MIRVPVHGLRQGVFTGAGALYHYVARVHRLRVGDAVLLFDPAQRLEGEASIVALPREREQVDFAVAALRPGKVQAERSVRVVQGLPKGDKLDAIVRDATELGASEVWLCASERAIPTASDAGRIAKKLERLARIALEAARQSGRVDVPSILEPRSLEDCLAADPSELVLFLSPHATRSAGDALRTLDAHAAVSLYVGPEGGFSEAECALAAKHGATVAQCGPFVLRTETVVAALLGALRLLA